MPRKTKHEQISRGCEKAETNRTRYPRWRKVLTFDQIMATPPVRLPAKYYRRKRHTRLSRGRA